MSDEAPDLDEATLDELRAWLKAQEATHVTISRARYEAYKAAIRISEELARAADTADLLLRETHPGKAASLRQRVTAWIEARSALSVAGIHETEGGDS